MPEFSDYVLGGEQSNVGSFEVGDTYSRKVGEYTSIITEAGILDGRQIINWLGSHGFLGEAARQRAHTAGPAQTGPAQTGPAQTGPAPPPTRGQKVAGVVGQAVPWMMFPWGMALVTAHRAWQRRRANAKGGPGGPSAGPSRRPMTWNYRPNRRGPGQQRTTRLPRMFAGLGNAAFALHLAHGNSARRGPGGQRPRGRWQPRGRGTGQQR
jgi:hypothetical protein